MKIGKLTLIKKLRDLPAVETDTALHVKHIGVLYKLEKGPTEHMVLDNLIEEANTAYLQTRLGGDDMAGAGVALATVFALPAALVCFLFCIANIAFLVRLPDFAGLGMGITAAVGALVMLAMTVLMLALALQMASMDLVNDRDFHYRLCRRSRKLYVWRRNQLISASLDSLVPCHFRAGTATASVGVMYLVDYDREKGIVRYAHKLSPSSSLKEDSQAIWEFYRRYIDGEYERWRVMTQSPPLEYGEMAVMRNYWPARLGRRLMMRGGLWKPLGVLVTLAGGALVGGPWAFITWTHGRRKGPDWSGIPAEELTPDPVEEAAHPHLLKFDPRKSVNPSPADWERPLYRVAMALGVPVWLGLIGGAIAGAAYFGGNAIYMGYLLGSTP